MTPHGNRAGGERGAAPIGACEARGLARQFGRPEGLAGRAVGRLMALKNRKVNRAAVAALGAGPDDRVLEVGCGPGTALRELAAHAVHGLVAGVDPSPVMVAQAARRCRNGVATGRVRVVAGSAERLPFPDAAFTKVLAVNSFHHWDDQAAGLDEARRVLAAGGMLLLALRVALEGGGRLSAPGFAGREIDAVLRLVSARGFVDVAVEIRRAGRDVALVTARR